METPCKQSNVDSDKPVNPTGSSGRPERRLVAEPRGSARRTAGAPPSNTAPSNRIEGQSAALILQTGVDSLYLSYAGELKPDVELNLEYLKKQAQSDDPLDQAQAVYCLCDRRFEVKDKGKGRYPYVLQDGVFHLQLSRVQARSLPMLYAQISSEALTRTGVKYTEIALNNMASVLARKLATATVSRVDLCADFVSAHDLETIPRIAWINRAIKRSAHEDRGRFSGLTFGMGGALSARLYDKTLEILRSDKTYLYDIWREAGWNGKRPVWRLEFQFGRPILHEFAIATVSDLLDRRAALWHYATAAWLRLTIPSTTDKTKDRWPNHPLWDLLTEAAWGIERGEPLTRSRKTRPPSEKSLFVNGLGAITSFMALEGISDVNEGARRFLSNAHAYHLRESQRTGKTLPTYAREKAQCKARRFNTLLENTGDPMQEDSCEPSWESE